MAKLRSRTHSFHDHRFILSKDDIFSVSLNLIKDRNNGCTVIMPHVCNNIGAFGAGFSGEIERRFPEVALNFSIGGKIKIGNTQFVTVVENNNTKNKLIVANMVAQNEVVSQKNPRPLHYPSLVKCMYAVKELADAIQQTEKTVRIHAPKFGSGLAGGNWNFIADLIDDIWSTHTVSIHIK